MTIVRIKGHDIEAINVVDSHSRRAVQFRNNIIASLKRINLTPDDIDIELEPNAVKKAAASATWYFNKERLHYSNNSRPKYVENLYVVSKVIDLEITKLINEKISIQDFVREFSEDDDVEKQRKTARKTLGLAENESDVAIIDKAYKDLAKQHHPDKETGSTEKFKEINHAHKILKRELT